MEYRYILKDDKEDKNFNYKKEATNVIDLVDLIKEFKKITEGKRDYEINKINKNMIQVPPDKELEDCILDKYLNTKMSLCEILNLYSIQTACYDNNGIYMGTYWDKNIMYSPNDDKELKLNKKDIVYDIYSGDVYMIMDVINLTRGRIIETLKNHSAEFVYGYILEGIDMYGKYVYKYGSDCICDRGLLNITDEESFTDIDDTVKENIRTRYRIIKKLFPDIIENKDLIDDKEIQKEIDKLL